MGTTSCRVKNSDVYFPFHSKALDLLKIRKPCLYTDLTKAAYYFNVFKVLVQHENVRLPDGGTTQVSTSDGGVQSSPADRSSDSSASEFSEEAIIHPAPPRKLLIFLLQIHTSFRCLSPLHSLPYISICSACQGLLSIQPTDYSQSGVLQTVIMAAVD